MGRIGAFRRRWTRRIWSPLAGRVLSLFVVATVAPLILALVQTRNGLIEAERRAYDDAHRAADSAAGEIANLVGSIQRQAATIEALPGFWDGSDADRDQILAALVAPRPTLSALLFYTPDFAQRGTSRYLPEVGRPSAVGRAYVREALAAGRLTAANETLRSLGTNRVILPLAVPVQRAGRPDQRGLIVGSIQWERLNQVLDAVDLPPGSGVQLIDTRSGRILAEGGQPGPETNAVLPPEIRTAIEAATPSFRQKDAQAVDSLYAWTGVRPTTWAIVVRIPVAATIQPIYAEAIRWGGLSVGIALTMVGLLLVVWRRIARQLRALRAAVDRWAAGDRSYRTGIQGGDELGQLASAFDEMAERLDRATSDLEASAERVRASEERLQSVIANAPVILFAADRDGVLTLVEGRGLASLQALPSSLIGRPLRSVSRVVPGWPGDFARALAGETFSVIREAADRSLEIWLTPIRDAAGTITGVTGVATDITERRRIEEVLAERGRRLEVLRAMSEEITRELDLTKLLGLINQRASELVGGLGGATFLWDEASEWLELRAWHGLPDWVAGFRLRLGEGASGIAAARRQGMIVNDYLNSPFAQPRLLERGEITAVLVEPLLYRDRLLGVISMLRQGDWPFTEADRDAFSLFASQAAIAIENAHLYRDLADRVDRLQTLTRLNQLISASLNLDDVLGEIARATTQLLDATVASFWMADEVNRTLEMRVLSDETIGADYPLQGIRYDQGVVGWVAEHRRPLHLANTEPNDRFVAPEWRRRHGLTSLLVVPVFDNGALLAVLSISGRQPIRYTPDQQRLLDGLLAQATVAIRNASLYTALAEANAQLKDALRQNELILNSVAEGICGLDRNGIIRFANPAAARLTGHPVDEMIGKSLHALAHHSRPDGTPYPAAECPNVFAYRRGEPFVCPLDFYWRKDGTSFPVEYYSNPIVEGGEVIGGVVTFRDITERQVIEHLKDEFVSVVSHELRTPLTSIRGSLGLLTGGVLGPLPPVGQQMLTIALNNTDRLGRLINDILDVERITFGRAHLNRVEAAIGDLMEQSVDLMRPMADQAGVHLAVMPLTVRWWVDPDRIVQTLTNLLSNAIKFSPPGGQVELGGRDRGGEIELWVHDRGRGIPAGKLESIFERFHQVDASDSREKGGTGLGLAICRGIIDQHGGRIWAESEIGRGSTFRIVLPAGSPEPGTAADRVAGAPAAPLPGGREEEAGPPSRPRWLARQPSDG